MSNVQPKLLRIPPNLRTVEDALAVAARLELLNVVIASEHENGNLTILHSGLTNAQINWLLDRVKQAMLGAPAELAE